MKRILVTGMSGTGKSSVLEELRSRGFAAIDTDYDDWCENYTLNGEPEWIWREDRMSSLLSAPLTNPLFVSGVTPIKENFTRCLTIKYFYLLPLK